MDVFDRKIQEIKAAALALIPTFFTEDKLAQMEQVLKDQYDMGEGGDGRIEPLKDYYPYTNDYIRKKSRKGLPSDRVTLYFSGELYENLALIVGSGQLDIEFGGGNEDLAEWIRGFYGIEVFSPNEDSLERIRSIMIS